MRRSNLDANAPKVKGRIITTVAKAKEIRPLVEKCVTIAKRIRVAEQAASEFGTTAARNSSEWESWRKGPNYAKWVAARGPVVAARRKLFATLRDKKAVKVLVDVIADRFLDRPGGYTRILKLATPRLAMPVPEQSSSSRARMIAFTSAREARLWWRDRVEHCNRIVTPVNQRQQWVPA